MEKLSPRETNCGQEFTTEGSEAMQCDSRAHT